MKQNETKKVPKSTNIFTCTICDYTTSRKSHYERHILTPKHQNETNETNLGTKSTKKYQCLCGKLYNSRTTLWRHKHICKSEIENCNNELNEINDINDINDKNLILLLIKQNSDLIKENSEFNFFCWRIKRLVSS
jgi:hypothetical protein